MYYKTFKMCAYGRRFVKKFKKVMLNVLLWYKTGCISSISPASQSQDKQLQEGRVYEQVLIFTLKLGEPG